MPSAQIKTYWRYRPLPITTPDEALALAHKAVEKYRRISKDNQVWAGPCSDLAVMATELIEKRQFDESSIREFHDRFLAAIYMLKGIGDLLVLHAWLVEEASKWDSESQAGPNNPQPQSGSPLAGAERGKMVD